MGFLAFASTDVVPQGSRDTFRIGDVDILSISSFFARRNGDEMTLAEKVIEVGLTGLGSFGLGAALGMVTGRMAQISPPFKGFVNGMLEMPWTLNWRSMGTFFGIFFGSATLVKRIRGVEDIHNTPIGAFVAGGIIHFTSFPNKPLMSSVSMALTAALAAYTTDVFIPLLHDVCSVERLQDDVSLLKSP